MTGESISQESRLKEIIDEERNYYIEEIKQNEFAQKAQKDL